MGLDITFKLSPALEAGLVIKTMVQSYDDKEEACNVMSVPGEDVFVDISISPDTGEGIFGHVRANKWGKTYEPLTEFLKLNGIDWREY